MKVNPQIRVDLDEYPELGKLYETAIVSVVRIMQIHDIVELRRIEKSGVFGCGYDKDVVTPIGIPNVPATVASSRNAVGKVLLDYLELIGVSCLSISVERGDSAALAQTWAVQQQDGKPDEKCVGRDATTEGADSESADNAKDRHNAEDHTKETDEQKGVANGESAS